MKVIFTATALQDLNDISEWLANNYPALAPQSSDASALSSHA